MAKKIDLDGDAKYGEPASSRANFSPDVHFDEENEVRGLSHTELGNPDNIMVTIADQRIPIVVLFGPPTCGKTMTLIRLTRYLQKDGYKVSPVRSLYQDVRRIQRDGP